MIQTEVCPWCSATITVSCGRRPCPACSKAIDVFPDDTALLRRIVQLGIAELWGKVGQFLGTRP